MLRIKIKYSTNYIGIFILLLYFCIIVGDWGLGIGDCNPQSPIPNPQVLINKV